MWNVYAVSLRSRSRSRDTSLVPNAELIHRHQPDAVHGVGREGQTGDRPNARAIAVEPVRVGRDADLFPCLIQILGGQEIAILPHRGKDLLLDRLPQLGDEFGRGIAPRGIVQG